MQKDHDADPFWDEFVSFENLWKAWRKARRGKRKKDGCLLFEAHLEEEILHIQEQLIAGSFSFAPYRTFTVYEPVERLIAAAPFKDRVVHHAIMNVLEPLLEASMIEHSYACRKNKGTHKALATAQQFLKPSTWVLKLDIRKYFFSIDQEILLRKLGDILPSHRMLELITVLLKTYESGQQYYFPLPGDDLFSATRTRGLPIGNLTSQWLANFYLSAFDHFVCRDLDASGYVRYMDDMIVYGSSKEEVTTWKAQIIQQLAKDRLTVHPKKTQIFPVKNGVKFLGHHLWRCRRRVLRPNLKRFKKRMKRRTHEWENAWIDRSAIAQGLNGWLGFVQEPGRTITEHILSGVPFEKDGERFHFTVIF